MLESYLRSESTSTVSATIIPIILSSDKTHLSKSGSTKAWPVYMSIGNIAHDVRFTPKYHAARLVALLPTVLGNSGYHRS
jgi:hypothetical protein